MTAKHRRRFLKQVAATGTVTLAGCSDSGSSEEDGNGSESDGGDDGGDETTEDGSDGGTDDGGELSFTESGPADANIWWNKIEELAVVSLESQASNVFSVTVTLENTGKKRTNVMNYSYSFMLFDDDGTRLGVVTANKANLGAGMDPGQQGSLIATPQFYDGEPDDVARYYLLINCWEQEGEDRGVYCS